MVNTRSVLFGSSTCPSYPSEADRPRGARSSAGFLKERRSRNPRLTVGSVLLSRHIALRRVGDACICRIGECNVDRRGCRPNRQSARDHDVRHTARGWKRRQCNSRGQRGKEHINGARQGTNSGTRHGNRTGVLTCCPVQGEGRCVQLRASAVLANSRFSATKKLVPHGHEPSAATGLAIRTTIAQSAEMCLECLQVCRVSPVCLASPEWLELPSVYRCMLFFTRPTPGWRCVRE